MDRRPPGIPLDADEDRETDRNAEGESVDPATVARIRQALANPRPPSPAAEAFARVDARIAEYKAKRGA
jgi:peptidoglycan hydrolase-like protein with peptidoglycan-binding domain